MVIIEADLGSLLFTPCGWVSSGERVIQYASIHTLEPYSPASPNMLLSMRPAAVIELLLETARGKHASNQGSQTTITNPRHPNRKFPDLLVAISQRSNVPGRLYTSKYQRVVRIHTPGTTGWEQSPAPTYQLTKSTHSECLYCDPSCLLVS
jgi:hypothetical protein